MQKGDQLEYKEYRHKKDTSFNIPDDFFPVMRLLFEVSAVKDSAGSTWSTIIKKGFGIKDEHDHYERTIVLQCDGEHLLIPYDFYQGDTVYLRDVCPPAWKLEKYGYAGGYTPLADAITYIVPLVIRHIKKLPEGKKEVEQEWAVGPDNPVIPNINPRKTIISIESIILEAEEMVTIPAGTFAGYKFCMNSSRRAAWQQPTPVKYWVYLNKQVGLIRMVDISQPQYYIELTSIGK